MQPTEHYPPRFRVRQYPDEAALEAFGLGEMEQRCEERRARPSSPQPAVLLGGGCQD
jgi:hypothetical protein